jgi:hypothetical protein
MLEETTHFFNIMKLLYVQMNPWTTYKIDSSGVNLGGSSFHIEWNISLPKITFFFCVDNIYDKHCINAHFSFEIEVQLDMCTLPFVMLYMFTILR